MEGFGRLSSMSIGDERGGFVRFGGMCDERGGFVRFGGMFVRFGDMDDRLRFYNSLPPVSKTYGTLCLLFTTASQFGLYNPKHIALFYPLVFSRFEVWRLITNFFFLGNFSINFGIRLLMIARYGVQLENGPFQRRTADFLWMMIFGAFTLLALSAIPWFWSPFLGVSLVFMLLYVWSREFPNANISIYGLVSLKAFYLPWAMLALDVIFGSELMPDLLGIIAGHLYYFLTVLHPLASGKNILKTPKWVYPFDLSLGST
ncbi:Derlin-1 [Camellia lanceoleosa]|uniref:Derlin-1 n=1 Tax=Camellia lanceoleosa TaxID=1840588 RepID=A0ACC0FKV1_9ERIC|nr:Derlin-1 [Camellia lanceoleosa]